MKYSVYKHGSMHSKVAQMKADVMKTKILLSTYYLGQLLKHIKSIFIDVFLIGHLL